MEELNIPIKISFAQNREDIFLEYFLRDIEKGFYVDVGANDPIADSVTKIFYDKGWNGINIEPIKLYHQKLLKQRPRDINLKLGIANKNGSIIFREYKAYHGLSTMAREMLDAHEKQNDSNYEDYVEHKVPVKTLERVFDEHKVKHIHFLKVDVEGFEYEVLEGNNWDRYRPELICIEANHVLNDWRPLLEQAKYSLAFNDGLNDYYVAKESLGRAKDFSYIEAALPAQILSYSTANAFNVLIAKTKAERNAVIHRNADLVSNNEELDYRLRIVTDELDNLKGLKNLTKTFLHRLNQKIENKIYPIEQRTRIHMVKADPISLVDDITEQARLIDAYDAQYLTLLKLEANHMKSQVLKIYRSSVGAAIYCLKRGIRTIRKLLGLLRGKR